MSEEARRELLLHMYDQMFNDINRHITVVWQTVGVLVGAFAVFALAEKNIVPVDVACALIVLTAGWSWAHHVDAAYWYNRNLVVIANIEKLFLYAEDLKRVHYYFGAHRPNNKMIKHLRIQVALSFGVLGIVLLFHFYERVWPGIGQTWASFDPLRALPYVVMAAVTWYGVSLVKNRDRAYAAFLANSPGVPINTAGIQFGAGHGHSSSPPSAATNVIPNETNRET